MCHRFVSAACNTLFATVEINRPLSALVNDNAETAAGHHGLLVGLFNRHMVAVAFIKLEHGAAFQYTVKMNQLHADHARKRGMELHRQQRGIDHISTAPERGCRCVSGQSVAGLVYCIGLYR
ncbi:hypothetical protein D3C71_1899200 [compost metagenome]